MADLASSNGIAKEATVFLPERAHPLMESLQKRVVPLLSPPEATPSVPGTVLYRVHYPVLYSTCTVNSYIVKHVSFLPRVSKMLNFSSLKNPLNRADSESRVLRCLTERCLTIAIYCIILPGTVLYVYTQYYKKSITILQ